MDPGPHNGRGNAGRQIAIANQANARAHGTNFADQFLVAIAIEDHHNQVFDVAVEPLRDGLEVVGDRCIKIHRTLAGRSDDNLFHVQIRSVQQSAALAGGENGDGIRCPRRAKIRAFKWIDGDIDSGEKRLRERAWPDRPFRRCRAWELHRARPHQ